MIGSPLRYPGGKTRACKALHNFFTVYFEPKSFDTVRSPFFGGGSFEFYLASRYGYRVLANDKFKPLYSFWQSCKVNKEELCSRLETASEEDINKEVFAAYRKQIVLLDESPLQQAVPFYLMNRCSFNGSTMSGGFSQHARKHRFTPSSVAKLRKMDLSNVEFTNCNAFDVIADRESSINRDCVNDIMFLDPPYDLKSKLYGYRGHLHDGFDHDMLYEMIRYQKRWILTYNDCPVIRERYKAFHIESASWAYGMNRSKRSSEIVIISE